MTKNTNSVDKMTLNKTTGLQNDELIKNGQLTIRLNDKKDRLAK
jgi:hypothetical protein